MGNNSDKNARKWYIEYLEKAENIKSIKSKLNHLDRIPCNLKLQSGTIDDVSADIKMKDGDDTYYFEIKVQNEIKNRKKGYIYYKEYFGEVALSQIISAIKNKNRYTFVFMRHIGNNTYTHEEISPSVFFKYIVAKPEISFKFYIGLDTPSIPDKCKIYPSKTNVKLKDFENFIINIRAGLLDDDLL